jgi:hypothetical protein
VLGEELVRRAAHVGPVGVVQEHVRVGGEVRQHRLEVFEDGRVVVVAVDVRQVDRASELGDGRRHVGRRAAPHELEAVAEA